MDGRVVVVFVCPDKGEPMQKAKPHAKALAGLGLEGDRYALGKGAHSKSPREVVRHVTLIEIEAIWDANLESGGSGQIFHLSETRRNIVTRGVRLSELVDRVFLVGEVRMRGVEICGPCVRPSVLSGKSGFKEAFTGTRGGIRAEVLSDGIIRRADRIVLETTKS